MKKKQLLTIFLLLVLLALLAVSASAADDGKWITAWGTGSTNISLPGYNNIPAFVGQVTARTVITPTASGDKLRVRLSNHFGDEPLTVDTVTVAKSLGGSRIDTASLRFVTFSGSPAVTIPVGGEIYSDEVAFPVTAMEDIALSVFLKNLGRIKTMGLSGGETYLSIGDEDKTRDFSMGIANELDDTYLRIFESVGIGLDRSLSYSIIHVVPLFSSVDVYNSSPDSYSVVVVGDSTVSNDFPEYLAEQINQAGTTDVGVVGKGIIGNSLGRDGLGFGSFLFGESMLKRFERDVLSQSGVKYVIVKIGTNDIVHPVCQDVVEENPGIRQPTAEEIIENFRTVFRTCHANNIKVIAVGITQWKGYTRNFLNTGARYVRTDEELAADWEIAQKVNRWLAITTEHDGFVDYYDITKNPEDPSAMLPEYTLDGAHPTDLCQRVWAREFPLGLIGIGGRVGGVRLNTAEINLKIGNTQKLTATVIPDYAKNKNVKWATSNSSVATVDQNGLVRGVGNGTCEITVETEEGAKRAHCIVHVTVPHTHSPGSWVLAKTPTCTETGLQEQRCVVCGALLNQETVPANGHSKGNWETTQVQTCLEDGFRVRKCLDCGEELDREILHATGHSFGEWKTFLPIDQDQAGIDVRFCKACGFYELRESAVSGDDVIPTDPTDPTDTTEPTGESEHSNTNENPTDDHEEDHCSWCGEVHEGFFQKMIAFFHSIFAKLFGERY